MRDASFSWVEKNVSSTNYVSGVIPLILPLQRRSGSSFSQYMEADEFFVRQKFNSRVNTASKQKDEGIHSGTGASPSTNQKTADTVKIDFVTSALHFFSYLLEITLRQSDRKSDIVKGFVAFDPFIHFKRPTEVGLHDFVYYLPSTVLSDQC